MDSFNLSDKAVAISLKLLLQNISCCTVSIVLFYPKSNILHQLMKHKLFSGWGAAVVCLGLSVTILCKT